MDLDPRGAMAQATPAPAAAAHGAGAEVVLQGVGKRYGAFVALDAVSLHVRAGEFMSLLGPSGSGKSTTLMAIAGFEPPDGGEILVGGRAVTGLPPHRRGIGMVFQSYALFPHLTVADNVGFALKQRGVAAAERQARVAAALDLVRLSGFAARYPRQLSGGQQQRVAIARAVIFDPPVLLMDEPLSALDKQLREEMQFEIKRLHDRLGITFVYVTHDQKEALVMSDRVAVMNAGRIEQVGTPAALYDRPANRFVAGFVGEANLLPVEDAGMAPDGRHRLLRLFGQVLHAMPREDAAAAGSDAPGGGALCMVRPEKIVVGSTSAGADGMGALPGRNALRAVVREVAFMGEMTRCVLEAASGCLITVKQQHRAGMPALQPGQPAILEWAVSDTLLV